MSSLIRFIHGGGIVMYPLLLLSLTAVVVIVERLLAFRQIGHLAPGLLERVVRLCRAGQFDDAVRATEGSSGPLAAALSTILMHRLSATEEIDRLVQETGQEYFIRLERYLPILDTTTTIAPLLGLLGTIVGMIGTFNAIAAQQNRGNSDAVLSGVGEALYATATGILIAVVCFVAYNYFAARVRSVTAETEQAATKLINVLVEIHHQEGARPGGSGAEEARRGIQAGSRA